MVDENLLYFFSLLITALGIGIFYAVLKKQAPTLREFIRTSNTTPNLKHFTTDFTALARNGHLDPVIGREDELLRLTQILSRRTKNNVILIGKPGVGKTAIVEGLAERIASNRVPETLANKRILSLDITTLMSGTKYRGEFEERIKHVIDEIQHANRSIILFIDEIHSIIQSQGSEGSLNLSDILKPALARGDLQMIGATTTEEYTKYFSTGASLTRRFQLIEVHEPSPDEALAILNGVKDKYREYHKVEFTDGALFTAVHLTNKLIVNRQLPDKAIDALDEAAAMVKVSHLHPVVSAVLFHAAAKAHPEVIDLWKQIQALDAQISKAGTSRTALIAQREKLEAALAERGLIVVDSSDIEQTIAHWVK